jgi:predicted Zn-dependent protease
METYFHELSETLCAGLAAGEVLLLNYQGEASDFVRLNHNRIRQAGHVHQQALELDLIRNGRESGASMPLCGSLDTDLTQARVLLERLRAQLPLLPEDPYLNYASEVHDSIHHGEDRLPESGAALETLLGAARGPQRRGCGKIQNWICSARLGKPGCCVACGQRYAKGTAGTWPYHPARRRQKCL